MVHSLIISREVQAFDSLQDSISQLFSDAMPPEQLEQIIKRQHFSPEEDETIAYWFARFLTIRFSFITIIRTALTNTGGMEQLTSDYDWQYFVLGYSAVCALVRMDRFLLAKVGTHTLIQRKLNEAFREHRIERKQFSDISKELLYPENALRINQAHRLLRKKHKLISQAVADSPVAHLLQQLPKLERYVDLSFRRYFLAWFSARCLSWRRRGASAKQKSLFAILEYGGRLAAELAMHHKKTVTPEIRKEIGRLLQPGDILITRHKRAVTNLFLPGFWPHAALYVGYEADRQRLAIEAEKKSLQHWRGKNCTLEALKDGVYFRPLKETIFVDSLVVLRPNLTEAEIASAIARVIVHAGKGYDFDFDFFRSDHLVCTEVIYRAYDGINNFTIPLKERVGKKTLSAEDLIDLTLDTDWASALAIVGVEGCENHLVTGDLVERLLRESYR